MRRGFSAHPRVRTSQTDARGLTGQDREAPSPVWVQSIEFRREQRSVTVLRTKYKCFGDRIRSCRNSLRVPVRVRDVASPCFYALYHADRDQRTQNQSRATDRGRPNRAITPLSNAVIALTRSPTKVTTIRPNACATRLMGLKR